MSFVRVARLLLGLACIATAQASSVLRLQQSITFPGVTGRIDHLAVDLSTARLFVCARYDNAARRIHVGSGNGGIATVDAVTGAQFGAIKLPGHPENFQLEQHGARIFANLPAVRYVSVIDRAKGQVIANWKPGLASANFPMALDELDHRLFVGCRIPPTLLVDRSRCAHRHFHSRTRPPAGRAA